MTLRMIAGIVTPDSGRIVLNGRVLFDSATGVNVPAAQRKIGVVFQDYALFPHMTVAENVGFGLSALARAGAAGARAAATGADAHCRIGRSLSRGNFRRATAARGHCALHGH